MSIFSDSEDFMLLEACERNEEEETIMDVLQQEEEEERETPSPHLDISEDESIMLNFHMCPVTNFDKIYEMDENIPLFGGQPYVSLAYPVSEDYLPEEQRRPVGTVVTRAGQCGTYIFRLVLKKVYTDRARYTDLRQCLTSLRGEMKERRVRTIAVPKIGCGGRDDLEWRFVRQMIQLIFKDDEDIRIVVHMSE